MSKTIIDLNKNNKLKFYFISILRQLTPQFILSAIYFKRIKQIKYFDEDYIQKRVNLYCKLKDIRSFSGGIQLKNFTLKNVKKRRMYFFDTYQYSRFFNENYRISFEFGDVTHIPEIPTIVKSRPINNQNSNSVLLNLDKNRHFTFIKDKKSFTDKTDMLIGRNYFTVDQQDHRIDFLKKYKDHPMCDVGIINKVSGYEQFLKNKISIEEHLKYKFVLCLEGNDVATNLKWVMSSNSLAVMPKPKFETWFMESTLVADHHYVEIKADYSDLQDKMEFYINNSEKALEIISNANDYVNQFQNKKREDLISLLVLEKYFRMTDQK